MIRNPITWPDNARCAVSLSFDMDADSGLQLNYPDTVHNRIATSSILRYGPEIAVPRLVDLFHRFGIRQTFFVPGWCAERYPAAVELLMANGHEVAHHGYLHERPNELSAEVELEILQRGIEAITRVAGQRPRGYRAPSYAFSAHTLDYLVDEEFTYDSSLGGDDIPYMIQGEKGSLVEVPAEMTMDDWPQYVCNRELGYTMPIASPRRAMEVFRAEFDAAWQYGGLCVSVWHPFVSGRLARCDAILDLLNYMQEKGGVWFATIEEIAAHAAGCARTGSWSPRIDRLPYYDGPLPEVLRKGE